MFRKYINLIESHADELLTHTISVSVADGEHEGFKPYWKLLADERVLSDHDSMTHIAGLISDGYRSGAHPHWELKVVEGQEDELDEAIEVVHAHMVVPVAQTHGEGQGWFEVSDTEATMWVVEDEHGEPVDSYPSRKVAVEKCEALNANTAPTDMMAYRAAKTHELELVEDDESGEWSNEPDDGHEHEFSDDFDHLPDTGTGANTVMCIHCGMLSAEDTNDDEMAEADAPTRFDKSENFVVIINAIHDRGDCQEDALRELTKRGLWLSDEQKVQAGLK